MTDISPDEIISALPGLKYQDIKRVREAAEQIQEAMRAEAKAKAESMDMRCLDGNGKRSRKPRSAKVEDEAEAN